MAGETIERAAIKLGMKIFDVPRPGRPRLLSPDAERVAALDRRSLRDVAWDYGVTSGTVARWRREHRPTPTGRAEG